MGDEPRSTGGPEPRDTQPQSSRPTSPSFESLDPSIRVLSSRDGVARDTVRRSSHGGRLDRVTSLARATVASTHGELGPDELADAPLEVGQRVDHFQIMRLLGRGGMGEVYVARDTLLGRRVALKLIHPKYLGSPDAIAGFLEEARTTAKFSHPHIVMIHAVGEHEGRPYVALEYLEGENLRKRMVARRLSLQATLRIALAVAEALDEAHRGGVLHLDLKPENVMIPEDGRVRVVDFGLARPATVLESGEVRADDDRTGVWGTPAYMAPEQWLRKKPSAATDVWGLGMMLFELSSDWLPYDLEGTKTKLMTAVCEPEPVPRIERYADVPTDVADLIAACLDKDPRKRPKVPEVAETLRELLFRGATRPADDEGPFRGLLPFTERHVGLFFGREAEVTVFVERTRLQPVLPVVGPSGAGKSSFVQAGVLPRLREDGAWLFVKMRPGSRPFESLAARLSRAERDTVTLPPQPSSAASLRDLTSGEVPSSGGLDAGDARRLAEALAAAPQRLALELQRMAQENEARVLLFVDQVEELFTLCEDAGERRAFMEAICTAAEDADDPVRVVFTVRDDYLGRLALGPVVTRALTQVTVIQTLPHPALEDTLVSPLASVGYRFEDADLVKEMVASVADAPGALPMLQFAARQLWERRDKGKRVLLRAAYLEMGGVEGALATHADGVLDAMSPAQLKLARELLLRLVTEDRTRARLPKADCLAGLGDGASLVLSRLTQARLLVTTKRARDSDAQAMLELAHDALIDSWKTLSRWLDESRDELSFVHEAGQAAALWDKRGRRPEELWRGAALADALRRSSRTTTEIPAVTRAFLEAASEREGQRARRRRVLFGGTLLALTSLVAVFATVAWIVRDKEREATRQRDLAERQRAATLRESARAAMNQGSVLEARAKLRLALDVEDDPAARALFWQLSEDPLVWNRKLGDRVFGVAFSADGTQVAAGCADEAIYLVDARTSQMRVFHGHGDQVLGVSLAPGGDRLVTISTGGRAQLWDVATGTPTRAIGSHDQRPTGVRFSRDGQRVATSSTDGTVRVWRLDASSEPRVVDLGDEVDAVDLHPESDVVIAASAAELAFIHPDGEISRRDIGHSGVIHSLRFSPDGVRVAAGGADGRVTIVDLRGGEPLHLTGHVGAVWAVAFDGTGERLASVGDDGKLRVWDVAARRLARELSAHEKQITGVDLSADGRFAVTSSFDGTIALWDLEAGGGGPRAAAPRAGVRGLAFSPDGTTLAAGSYDGRLRLWDVATGELERTLSGHTGRVFEVAFSHDGRALASTSADWSARVWDLDTGMEARILAGHSGPVVGVAFSPDDRLLATGSKDTTVRLWDLAAGTHRVLSGHGAEVGGVDFSDDGALLASGGRDVRVWEVASGALDERLGDRGDAILGVRFDGRRVTTGSTDGTVRRWDVAGGEAHIVGRHPERVYWIDTHGDRVSASSSDGVARIWEAGVKTEPLLVAGHDDEVNNAVFSPDGRLVATASDDGTVRVWTGDARPHWRAPALLSSPALLLSHRGWTTFGKAAQTPPNRRWVAAIEKRARWAGDAGEHVCILTHEGEVEVWHEGDDALRRRAPGPAEQVLPVAGGCLARSARGVELFTVQGEAVTLPLSGAPSAIGASGDELIVAAGSSLHFFSGAGEPTSERVAAAGMSAVARVAGRVVVGYRDGHIELSRPPGASSAPLALSGVPSSRVLRIVEGPSQTVAAGYANGFVGLWSLRDGSLLASSLLHGRIAHLLVDDEHLVAASDLGAPMVWDLGAFHLPYCQLLREVWRRIPVVWEDGRPVLESAPTAHRCGAGP